MIRNYNLIRSIFSEPWLISQHEAEKLGVLLSGVLTPNLEFEPMTKEDAARACYVQQVRSQDSTQVRDIGVVRITGALTKYDTLCAYGMESYRQMIRDFKNNDGISAIVLEIDSPGGTVAGTEELGEEIRASDKPVIAFVSDAAFSAAYWLAANCREIIANNTTAQVGSIGVICSYMDLSEYYKNAGITIHEILPEQSKDKREEEQLVKAGKYDLTKERLGVLADKFRGVVRAGRPGVNDDQLTGKCFYAQDVIGSLVDRIDTFGGALVRAADLAAEKENSHKNQDSMKKEQFPNLARAAGVESLESADGSIHLTADMAAAVEASLGAADEDPEGDPDEDQEVETEQETVETPADSALQAQITRLEATVKAQAAQIAALNREPGATGATVTPETDADSAGESPANSFIGAFEEALEIAKTLKGEM